jgi:hypothetical protein
VSNVSLSAGEDVTCTFTNSKRGQIVVVKDAQPNDPQDFSFTTGGGLSPGSFTLDDDSDPAHPNTQTIADVPAGAGYSVSESVPAGWDQTAATCDDGSPVSNIDVGPDETVTCTFTNRKRGQIVVIKDAVPNDPQDFSFTAGGLSPASFQLDDDTDPTLSNTRTFADVVPGSGYSLAEAPETGWTQSGAACNDGSPLGNIAVSAGETVTCTFTNARGYPRPKAATPLNVSLVIAYADCTSPNRAHASPLSFASCNPPAVTSGFLTAGTPDNNGNPANFVGNVLLRTINGDPLTPADEADVVVTAHVDDVRLKSNPVDDYTGQLGVRLLLRITDRYNGAGSAETGTGQDTEILIPVPCTATSGGGSVGADCDVTTSVDSVTPGAVPELKRAIWQLGRIEVLDGGADGLLSTNDNTVFARQGVFVP